MYRDIHVYIGTLCLGNKLDKVYGQGLEDARKQTGKELYVRDEEESGGGKGLRGERIGRVESQTQWGGWSRLRKSH